MHFQLSILAAGLVATIVQAQELESNYDSIYNDLSSTNNPLREDAFDDFGYYYGSPAPLFPPFNPGRAGRPLPDPYSWYFYNNGAPPPPYPRLPFGPYGGGSVWNQRSPYPFAPIAGYPYFNRGNNYYDTVYGNGVYTRNPYAGKAYDSGNLPIINGRDSARDYSTSFLEGLLPFLNRPSDGYAIIDSKIMSDRPKGIAIPKRTKLNPVKTDGRTNKVVPKAPLPPKKEGETTMKPVETPTQGEPQSQENPTASSLRVPTNQKPGEQNKPTNKGPTKKYHPGEGAIPVEEKPISADPIEQPIEKETVEPENDESTMISEPED